MMVRVGQIWMEDDNRRSRRVEVTAINGNKVTIVNRDNGRTTTAKLARFGVSKGYKLFRDAPIVDLKTSPKQTHSINYLMTNGSITLHYNGNTKVVAQTDERFEKVLAAIREKRLEDIPDIVEVERYLTKQGLDVRDGLVHVGSEPMPTELSERILSYKRHNLPFDSLLKFWENLKKNPSFNSRQQLFKFLENKGHSITPDGCFIGYRGVSEDFKDKHTRTFDNKPGSICKMDRSKVDDNPNNTCSHGLHIGGYDYAKDFGKGGKLVLVKVNPANVVAVPNDYNGQKMRVCEFEVLKEATDIVTDVVYEEDDFGSDSDDLASHFHGDI